MLAPDGKPPGLGEVALEVVGGVKEQVDLEGRIERSPYGSVGVALGIGYVLGGGIFTPLTARALHLGVRLGLRLVVLPIVAERLIALVQSASLGDSPAWTKPESPVRSRHNGAGPRMGI
jgi:hypothetical protein